MNSRAMRRSLRATGLGAGLGGWLGTLAGLVPGLLPGRPLGVLLLGGLLIGAVAGAVTGFLVHLATGSRRAAAGAVPPVRRHRRAGELERTVLPGFGTSYTFDAAGGHRVGVLAHPSGRREVLFYDPDDPDRVRHAAALTEVEAVTVAQVLGMPVFADTGSARRPPSVEMPNGGWLGQPAAVQT